jgi:hypothetical protein
VKRAAKDIKRYLKKPAGTYQRYRFGTECGDFGSCFRMSEDSHQFRYHPVLKEAAAPDRGLGHGTAPKQPVASPVLAMLDELESNLGCSIALTAIKSIDQYQRNFDVPGPPRRSQDQKKTRGITRYRRNRLMPMAEKSQRSSSELQWLNLTRASKAPERPAKSKGIF